MENKFEVILDKGVKSKKIKIRNMATGEIVSCEIEKLSYETLTNWPYVNGKGYVSEMEYLALLEWLSDTKLKDCRDKVENWIQEAGGKGEGGFF